MDDALETPPPSNEQLTEAQQKLVEQHIPLVKRLAYYLLGHLPKTVQLDDLIQAGMLGLIEAIKHYDDTKGAQFETYANIRVRGSILDEVRRNDWVPRSVYRHARMLDGAVKAVENRLGRPAKDHEIADELHVTLKDYYELQKDSLGGQLCSLDDLGLSDEVIGNELGVSGETPAEEVVHEDWKQHLTVMIEALPRNERLVLYLYYEHDLNLKEIGEVLGVSESRVSQIHTQATQHLKVTLSECDGAEEGKLGS